MQLLSSTGSASQERTSFFATAAAAAPAVHEAALGRPRELSELTRWWTRVERSARFGDVIIVLFLIAQVLDGAFTYVGVMTFGRSIEANPLLHWLMGQVGEGTAVTGAKVVAGTCGIALHLSAVHRIVAALTLLYLGAAIVPWIGVLFF